MNRTTAREIAFKMLFANQVFDNGFDNEVFANVLDGEKCSEKDLEFIKSLVLGVQQNKDELIGLVSKNLSSYKYERLFSVDKIVLLLCSYELVYQKDTPYKVAINEALNLVRKYSTEKSTAFVNSVLSKIYKEISNE